MASKTIFLSSTSKDLAKYRAAVIAAIDSLDGYKCIRMENFGARNWDADAFCRQQVTKADVFVCIVGLLYGSCPPNSTQSYTEREFDQAVASDKPRLIYFAPDDLPLPGNLRNTDEEHQKQQAFRQKANNGRIRASFTSPEDLTTHVISDIRNWENEQRDEPKPPRQYLRPLPLQPCFAHTYPIQKNFTGRVRERRMLTEWLTTSDKPVFAFIAIGGMGKSALTWAWVQRDVLGDPLPSATPDDPADTTPCRGLDDRLCDGLCGVGASVGEPLVWQAGFVEGKYSGSSTTVQELPQLIAAPKSAQARRPSCTNLRRCCINLSANCWAAR
jgi:hypothetical protein